MTASPDCRVACVLAVLFVRTDAVAEEPVRMTMTEAVRRATEHNPTLLVAREEINRARALVEEVRAQSLPTLYGTGTYLRLDRDRVFEGFVTEPKGQVNLEATLSVPLVNPRAWAQWAHARNDVDVSKAAAMDTRRTVAVATGHAYLAVFAQKRLLEANIRARDTAKAHFDYAHSRYAGGVGNRLDEVRAAQQVSADESLVQTSYAMIDSAQEALGVLVGLDVPVDSAEEPDFAPAPTLATAIDEGTKTRADVVAADRRRRAADQVHRDSWTDYSPFVSAIFQPFYQEPPTSQTPSTGWQGQVALTVPFYDGGLRYGLEKEREALAREAADSLEGTVRQTRSDVRAAFETLRRAEASLARSRDAARFAAEALSLAGTAYRGGATTNLEVIDAEQTSRDAEIQVEIASDTARQARLDVLAAIGRFP
ncbi:MAG: TolC family protein [Polyangiaceae bacterium]